MTCEQHEKSSKNKLQSLLIVWNSVKIKEDRPFLTTSPKNQRFVVEGYQFAIEIYRLNEELSWSLEVVDHVGTSHVWGELFKSESDARNAALQKLESQGALGFMHENNVVPFKA